MSERKYAVCTVINKKYMDYLKVFAFSLIKHNPGFDHDYIVFFKKGDLDEEGFVDLKKIYDGFVFQEIKTENYTNINLPPEFDSRSEHARSLFEWTYYRLEMFDLQGYEQVIWFDVDMLVLCNLNNLLEMRYDDGILACEDFLVKNLKSKEEYERDHKVQGGLIVVGKNMINESVYTDLLSLLSEAYRFKLNDQTMFTEYFGNKEKIKHISLKYNCGRKLCRNNVVSLKDVHILHYPGSKKPWNYLNNRHLSTSLHDLWLKTYDEMKTRDLI
jgi:lipopolysaccharide biosynthesis glycosyltransferase